MSTVPSKTLPQDLTDLRGSGSPEWDFLCGIVDAAYTSSVKDNKNEVTIKYMEGLMDLYGIERPVQ